MSLTTSRDASARLSGQQDRSPGRRLMLTPARQSLTSRSVASTQRRQIGKIHVRNPRAGIVGLKRRFESAWRCARTFRNGERNHAPDFGARSGDAHFRERQTNRTDNSAGNGKGRSRADRRAARIQKRDRTGAGSGRAARRGRSRIHDVDLGGFGTGQSYRRRVRCSGNRAAGCGLSQGGPRHERGGGQ
jgi:hypothetical protein